MPAWNLNLFDDGREEAPAPVPIRETLVQIRQDLGECERCGLAKHRSKIVFGDGPETASVVFVGEGPGEQEDLTGLPFVGRAGQLLTKMIDSTAEKDGLNIRRRDVYIYNAVKCRPPENRTPSSEEIQCCRQFLTRQILAVRPRYIVCLGASAAKALLGAEANKPLAALRSLSDLEWEGIPVQVTYHPSFLLRNPDPERRKESWQDLLRVLRAVCSTQ